MRVHHTLSSLGIILLALTCAQAQIPPPHPDTVPIYDVTVVGRNVSAVNYNYKSGPTQIHFKGTVLLPDSKGDATVESKSGRTEIDVHLEHLAPAQRFGNEYLTYVLWAITPEGHAKNLGEVVADSSDKSHTHVTTELQTFGLIVTAEPYAAVRIPGDVVVMENQVVPGTLGSTEPIQVHMELMPRGSYTYKVPAGPTPEGPKVSMAKYEELLELYQAQNALQIADSHGASKYASEVYETAKSKYENARNLEAHHANKNTVIAAARDAAQTAEDARTLAGARQHEAELASAKVDVEREQQLRRDAEQKTLQAQADATAAQAAKVAADNALEAERQSRRDAERQSRNEEAKAEAVAEAKATPPPPPPAPVSPPPPASTEPFHAHAELRAQLLSQLNGLEVLDTGRGIEVILHDSSFDGTTLLPNGSVGLGRVAGLIMSHPGLSVEIDGNSDTPGPAGDHFSMDRASSVREALTRIGLAPTLVTARGLGNSRPFGPNSTPKGKEDNRRVEVIIHGDPIGDQPSWQKSYSLNSNH